MGYAEVAGAIGGQVILTQAGGADCLIGAGLAARRAGQTRAIAKKVIVVALSTGASRGTGKAVGHGARKTLPITKV